MEFEAGLVVSFVLMIAAFVVDRPRALAGLAFGAISRYLPYGTIVVPTGVIILAAAGEFIYPEIGRTAHPSLVLVRDWALFGRRDGFKYLYNDTQL